MTGDPRLAWRSWPLKDDFPRSILLVVIVLGMSIAVGVSFEDPRVGLISLALLCVSVARYLAPTEYTLDATGVEARFLGRAQRRAWGEIRARYVHRDGVHLSPFSRPSPLDPFRGMYLRFSGNREAVLEFLKTHLPPREPPADSSASVQPGP